MTQASSKTAELPKRRKSQDTRLRILTAAQAAFSTVGYTQAGIREVAAAAGVNAALVLRYFGSKEQLFEAALEASVHVDDIWASNRAEFGRIVAKSLLDSKAKRANPLPMLMLSFSDPIARAIALAVLEKRLIEPLAERLGGPGAKNQVGEILALSGGFFMYRLLLPLEPFSGGGNPDVRTWFEEALQGIVDRSSTPGGPSSD